MPHWQAFEPYSRRHVHLAWATFWMAAREFRLTGALGSSFTGLLLLHVVPAFACPARVSPQADVVLQPLAFPPHGIRTALKPLGVHLRPPPTTSLSGQSKLTSDGIVVARTAPDPCSQFRKTRSGNEGSIRLRQAMLPMGGRLVAGPTQSIPMMLAGGSYVLR